MKASESERGAGDVAVPSLQALEAAATLRLVEMLQDSKTKPSEKAVLIAARMMALRAQRELHAKQSASGDGLPKS